MKLPVRKCYHAAKVGFFFLIVLIILSLFEQWRGGKRSARAQTLEEDEYERQIAEDEARIIPGLGEGGAAAHLVGEAKRLGEESEKKLAINVYLSDRISYNRSLKDHRNPACERVVYDAELPSASVILIFHNEPYSVVVRTIWSVVNSARRENEWYAKANYVDRETGRTMKLGYSGQDPTSPFVYLKEIILVDDNSTLPELKGKLSHYVRTRLPPDLIRIVRLPDRVGLTRARLAGSRYATGDVIVFLDSHCEAQRDWLRPLLQRIKDYPHAVVVPIIDVIEASNFYYSVQDPVTFQGLMRARIRGARVARGDVLIFLDAHCEANVDWLRPLLQRIRHKRDVAITPLIDVIDQTTFELQAASNFQVGGFTFMGHFTWIDVPEREKKRRGSDIAPTWSPTMAGGLFAINRQYFWEVGAYDEQMAGWGGENLEMSFRIWQCGGTLETIPCSRVGHVFRSFHPYGLPANTDTHGINTARMAEVWMDDYAELFYLHRPDLRKSPKIGDVTHRRVLREKLQCKSFQWYLDNVYREKFVPVRDVFGFGRFRNPGSGMCLDTLQHEGEAPLGVYPCHARLEPTQYLALSLRGELRDEERCAEPRYQRRMAVDADAMRTVLMGTCHGRQRGQKWRYLDSKQLQHVESAKCLTSPERAGDPVTVASCQALPSQIWHIDYSDLNGFKMGDKTLEPSDQELRLQRLRGQRRISRSLMSVSEDDSSRRHRKHRRSKQKNKFILSMVRTHNGTEEHLEADIYCKHKRLYPNNTFVRDLVKVLNSKNIKVINNGRVFEHNRVRKPTSQERALVNAPEHAPEFAHERATEPAPERVREHVSERAPDHKPERTEMSERSSEDDSPASSASDIPVNGVHESHKSKKKRKHDKKKKVEGRTESEPEDNINKNNEHQQKRIIIEDFVEIKPIASDNERPPKQRKRLRLRTTSPPEPLTTTKQGPDWEDAVKTDTGSHEAVQNIVWTAPKLSAEEAKTEQESPEDWPVQVSYFRHGTRQPSTSKSSKSNRHRLTSSDKEVKGKSENKNLTPVKLIMRSNLTFNLGDELFRWRQRERTVDDVANLLDNLVIPNITQNRYSEQTDNELTIKDSDQDSSGTSESEGGNEGKGDE